MHIETNTQQKSSHRKYIISTVVILLLITFALVLFVFTQTRKPDPASEKIIREAAAAHLDKDPNELTDADFARITEISFGAPQTIIPLFNVEEPIKYTNNELTDIRLLEKFTNLQKLNLGAINVSETRIPTWMRILAKLGIFDLNERYAVDLSPLEKLTHLEELQLGGSAVINIKPLANLNLKNLQLISSPVSDITPLKSLTQLQSLDIIFCPNIKYEDVEELNKALPNLKISGTLNLNK